jgi:quinoprotein glucose dehydrogenase
VGVVGGSASFRPAGGGPLPLFKPPYGEVVAVNLNTGEIAWRSPVGDSPAMRNHPALKGIALPDRLGVPGAPGAIVTNGGLVFIGGADTGLNAFDAKTGELVHRVDLGRRTSGTPMTYRSPSGRQVIVIATGAGRDATLVALALQ